MGKAKNCAEISSKVNGESIKLMMMFEARRSDTFLSA
jgi:hypothetical protein